jgi:hypothetical protein
MEPTHSANASQIKVTGVKHLLLIQFLFTCGSKMHEFKTLNKL